MPSPVTAALQSTSGRLAVTLSQTIPSQNRYSSQVTVWPLMASISPSGCRPLAWYSSPLVLLPPFMPPVTANAPTSATDTSTPAKKRIQLLLMCCFLLAGRCPVRLLCVLFMQPQSLHQSAGGGQRFLLGL